MTPKIALITADEKIIERTQLLASGISSTVSVFPSAENFESSDDAASFALIILHSATTKSEKDIAGHVQVAKYAAPSAYFLVIVDGRMGAATTSFIKKSGADSVILEPDYFSSSKPEFLCSQRLHGQYVPIKSSEIMVGKPLEMTIYHLMPLNRKLVKMMSFGDIPDAKKVEKIQAVGEFYIARGEVGAFQKYIDKNQDKTAAGLLSRCRAKYLYLTITYKNLVQLLSDQSETASFKEGRELSDLCYTLASDLIVSLSSAGDAWQVINNAAFNDMSIIDRVPAVASVAGLFSLMAGISQPNDLMVAALLADVGLLELSPQGCTILKTSGPENLSQADKDIYFNHPKLSIAQVLSRKIPLPDKMKDIIMCTHERIDEKGFPNKPIPKRIPMESMLISFAEKLDHRSKLEFGKERQDIKKIRADLLKEESSKGDCYSLEFLDKIRPLC